MSVVVTRALAEHAERWVHAVAALIDPAERDHELVSADEARISLSEPRCYAFLAERDGAPVGLISGYRFPDLEAGGEMVYLYDIEVLASERRGGIASALLNALKCQCLEDDVELIWAGTEASNTAARRTFEATGAVLEGDAYVEYEWPLDD